jgi:phosphate:Na+ symporter
MFICPGKAAEDMQTMDWVTVGFNIIGGLALFMYAITLLRETLGKISGARVAKLLEKATNNPVKGMGVGTAATFMTQSSSITVLTLIGFVNAGMMTFRQSVNVMLGSEIGTTITAQLVSFNIGMAFWPLIAIGFFIHMFARSERVRLVGKVLFSLGLIFLAMEFMKDGAEPLQGSPVFVALINNFGAIPIIGILIGALIAGITQSSSATTSLVIAMGMGNVIQLDAAIALVMGANIGTCFLEIFAAVGASTPAKRTALAQTIINIFGVGIFIPFLGPFAALVETTSPDLPRQIANAHTIFNVLVSIVLIPLVGLLVRFCERVIPKKEGETIGKHFFDEEMLHLPQVALREAEREVIRAADVTLEMIGLSNKALVGGDQEAAREVMRLEDEVDESVRESETFIDKIREEELSETDQLWRMKLLAILVDIERVGDQCDNLAEFAVYRIDNQITFSEEAESELADFISLVEETYGEAVRALKTRNKSVARRAVLLEDEIDKQERELRTNHVNRMEAGICSPRADAMFVETIRNLERIGDHADNIAADVIVVKSVHGPVRIVEPDA